MTRRGCALLLFSFCMLWLPSIARAQTAPTEIEVRVVDEAGATVPNARVFITGEDATAALTPANGVIRFSDVSAGLYRIGVTRKGYESASVSQVEALPGRRVIVSVTLQHTAPPAASGSPSEGAAATREIGRVRARPAVSVRSVDVDEDSPIRRISENLSDALDKIAGVSVASPPSGNTLTVSVRNGNAANSVNSIGGSPVAGAGASTLQAVAADLSTGVSADGTSSITNVGGSVNFRTLEPTKTWQQQLSASYGTYEKTSAQVSLSGSLGKLGIALQHATRGGDGVLSGLRYLDTSGADYIHDSGSSRDGDFAKLRYALSPTLTLSAGYLAGTTRTATACYTDVTDVPCGYGPGGLTQSFADVANARLQGQIGLITTSINYSRTHYTSADNELGRQFLGTPSAYATSGAQNTTSINSFSTAGFGRHTILLNAGGTWGAGLQSISGAFGGTSPTTLRFGYYVLGDTVKFSDRWSMTLADGINSRLAQSSNAADFDLTLTPSTNESWSIDAGTYGGGTVYSGATLYSDPTTAIYNCGAGTVGVSGPTDGAVPGTYHTLNASYSRRGKRGSIRLSAYSGTDANTSEQVQLPATALDAGAFPAGYFAAIETIWHNPLICGKTAFSAGGVLISKQISGIGERNAGIDASGQYQLGRGVVAQASYSINGAVLRTSDPRLEVPGSTYRIGSQLPGRPLHKANLLIDGVQGRARREWIVNATWVSGNNGNYIPSYVVASAGVTQTVARGRLSLFANNLFNVNAGVFATNSFAQSLTTNAGAPQLQTPTLITPRTYTILYSVRSGRLR